MAKEEKKVKAEPKVEVKKVEKIEPKVASGWVKVTLEQLLSLQAEGKVAGYNGTEALIVEVK